jgi:hypothetical protein
MEGRRFEAWEHREVRPVTRLPFADPRYEPPTPSEFRSVLQIAGWSGELAAARLGLNSARTVRKLVGGEREIPYSLWRLMLLETGFALDEEVSDVELEGRPADDV